MTNTLAFDIAQFFPSLNYHLLSLILRKVGFDSKAERLDISRTIFLFFFNIDVGVS